MAIDFLTNSRVYDPHRGCISFWGHDAAIEISFKLDQAVLEPLLYSHQGRLNELSALMIFDQNIKRTRAFARKLYTTDKKTSFAISGGHI
ncbi:MAG: hypothetical protein H6R00_1441 [Proteobacteria bacterium]|nr:hypothetical protein [Pseudomonadota bacterium]